MVKALHRAGIEVILDVVYNHTAEGASSAPRSRFKGVDNAAYYRLDPDDPRHYMDVTGPATRSTRAPARAAADHGLPAVLGGGVRVDGFRFDLASRSPRSTTSTGLGFFDIIHQDPVLSQVKLIAEPWDVGPGGYQVGNFPTSGPSGTACTATRCGTSGAATRRSPSSRGASPARRPLQAAAASPPRRSTSSPATTASRSRDLVILRRKHNEANGEDNRDGTDDNRSWNCGVEGETDEPVINGLRDRQMRNVLATLLLSQGTPMLFAATSGPRSSGNNNAYCQDNAISWLDWDLGDRAAALLEFTKRCCASAASIPCSGAPRSSPVRSGRARAHPTSGGSGRTAAR